MKTAFVIMLCAAAWGQVATAHEPIMGDTLVFVRPQIGDCFKLASDTLLEKIPCPVSEGKSDHPELREACPMIPPDGTIADPTQAESDCTARWMGLQVGEIKRAPKSEPVDVPAIRVHKSANSLLLLEVPAWECGDPTRILEHDGQIPATFWCRKPQP
jgi:hypothetical protein